MVRIGFYALVVALLVSDAAACTAIAVDPKATTDKCAYTTMTSDCKECDFRLAYVPARTHAPGAMRPVYEVRFQYPHVVSNRARTWLRSNLQGSPAQLAAWGETKPMGYIPEVKSTYALYETGSGYAIINEHSVSVGESTCTAVFASRPVSAGGKALMDVGELSKIALERAATARDAIRVMGEMAERYGYYGAEYDLETKYLEAGEALMVADSNEAWAFHVLPDDTGSSAIWAAQRVPDGHITVVANYFIIRGIDTTDKANFMYSANMLEVARKHGLTKTDEKGRLDFAATYGLPRPHSSYTTLRRWRVLTLAAPELAAVLNSTTESDLPPDFPFSARVTASLDSDSFVAMQRDHFEGTVYDLTKGMAAGAFSDPDRYDTEAVGGMSVERAKSGEFARGISLFRTSYSTVSRGCAALPREVSAMTRVAQQQPDASSFVPMYVSAGEVPEPVARGSLFRFDRRSYFWRVALVSNWAHRYYRHAIPYVHAVQASLETAADWRKTDAAATRLVRADQLNEAAALMRARTLDAIRDAHRAYARLFFQLVAKLHDGYVMRDANAETVTMESFFYPEKWLELVGYFSARETSVEKGREALRRAQNRLHTYTVTHTDMAAERQHVELPVTSRGFWRGSLFGLALGLTLFLLIFGAPKVRTDYRTIT